MANASVFSLIILISVIAVIAGIALLIISIVFTAKGKKGFIAGIITGAVIGLAGVMFFTYGAFGALVSGVSTAASDLASTEFTPAEGSRPISGTLKINGDEVKFPCMVTDLTKLGYNTDFEYFNYNITLWPMGSDNSHHEAPQFYAYIDRSYGYKSYDHVKGSDQVDAVMVRHDLGIDFELNDISFGMSKEAFIKEYGTPAYEIDHSFFGDSLYYLGDNDVIYRFNFGDDGSSDKPLVGLMAGTSEYMKLEMKGLYHT